MNVNGRKMSLQQLFPFQTLFTPKAIKVFFAFVEKGASLSLSFSLTAEIKRRKRKNFFPV